MNVVWLINLFIIKKETPAAGFKTSTSLCLPQISRLDNLSKWLVSAKINHLQGT